MKNALIVGGSRGLGHALAIKLEKERYENIIILDKTAPETTIPKVKYYQFDIYKDNLNILDNFNDIDTLIITAGIGRLASFDTFNDIEIEKTFQINTISIIKIIRYFYPKIKNNQSFFCCIVSSISGIVSSPLFSLYAATKSALYRFAESINIELEKENSNNRILNICPGFLGGTSFYGKDSDFSQLEELTNEILHKMYNRDTIFIPDFNKTYSDVLDRYRKDSRSFGLESYAYKKNSGRIVPNPMVKIGYLSGTFDLFHVGHLNILRQAKKYCDFLVVGVHKDALHKGKDVFIPFDERCDIVKNIIYVNKVIASKPEDCDVYHEVKYDYLFVGSDYKGTERFRKYEEYFTDKNVEIVYIPYTHKTSSTKLREVIDRKRKEGIYAPS